MQINSSTSYSKKGPVLHHLSWRIAHQNFSKWTDVIVSTCISCFNLFTMPAFLHQIQFALNRQYNAFIEGSLWIPGGHSVQTEERNGGEEFRNWPFTWWAGFIQKTSGDAYNSSEVRCYNMYFDRYLVFEILRWLKVFHMTWHFLGIIISQETQWCQKFLRIPWNFNIFGRVWPIDLYRSWPIADSESDLFVGYRRSYWKK